MTLELITPPTEEPVALAEMKEHLRVTHESDDGLILGLISAARRAVEARGALSLVQQGWRLIRDRAPARALVLPRAPVISVDQVAIVRPGGVVEPLAQGLYDIETGPRGRVLLNGAVPWAGRALGALRIDFTAGWPGAGAVPEELKLAVMMIVAHFYENREGAQAERLFSTPLAVDALIAPFRELRL
jgi:uncharacterized phiE125 gp8 family phage protein